MDKAPDFYAGVKTKDCILPSPFALHRDEDDPSQPKVSAPSHRRIASSTETDEESEKTRVKPSIHFFHYYLHH